MQGIVTKIFEERNYFLIDNNYRCYYDKVNFKPKVFDQVEYDQSTDKNGKPRAENVKLLSAAIETKDKTTQNFFPKYLEELSKGYFEHGDFIKKEFVVEYPKELVKLFSKSYSINKSSQIRKYFDFCRKVEGLFRVRRDFNYVKSELPKLIPHVYNALNKKQPLISKDFSDFIEKNVEKAILNEANFLKGFIVHFESVIAYFKNK